MLSNELETCLQDAYHQAREARHAHLTVEHLLLCIIDAPKVREILGGCGSDLGKLRQDLKEQVERTPRLKDEQEAKQLQPALGFQRVLQRAVFHVQSSCRKEVGVANVLVAIFSEKHSHAVSLLQAQGVTRLDVVNYISHGLTRRAQRTAAPSEEPDDLDQAAQALQQQELAGGGADGDRALMRFLDTVLSHALKDQASEVHMEPFVGRLVIRFRVPEGLREVLQLPRGLAPPLIAGIKRVVGLDPDSTLPQDTRINLKDKGRLLDLRIATLSSHQGERVVMHVEPGYSDFASLGMDAGMAQQLDALLGRPGLLIVAGPARSGRTTALYTALARCDERLLNIMTVEDRIDRTFDGISQSEVSAELASGRALEAVLRHEPDIVMIDELRDDTILAAVEASARKQVLASVKAPTAADAITNLIDLGVAPALLAPVLSGVLALRLVRRLDPATREAFRPGEAERRILRLKPDDPAPEIYRAAAARGYRGYIGLHELVLVDDALRTMIREGASTQALEQHIRQSSGSLWDAGRAKVLSGETTIEEVFGGG